jgi:hypothetical protein
MILDASGTLLGWDTVSNYVDLLTSTLQPPGEFAWQNLYSIEAMGWKSGTLEAVVNSLPGSC